MLMSCSSGTLLVVQCCSNTWQKEPPRNRLPGCFWWLCPTGASRIGSLSTQCQMILLPTSPQSDTSSCITVVPMKRFRLLLFCAIKNNCPRQPSACSTGSTILSQKDCLCSLKTSSNWNPESSEEKNEQEMRRTEARALARSHKAPLGDAQMSEGEK